jgi:hypothetical protein
MPMRTEEIQRTPRSRDPNEVSRALQELTPLSCAIVDRRGRPVPLSSAGYVLRFGHSYHLRLLSPFHEEDIQTIRLINPPPFLTVEPELPEVDEQGRSVRSIPFKVSLDLWTHMRKLGMGIYSDDLEIVHYFRPGLFREAPAFFCPIVARPRWTVIIVAVLLGILFILLEKIVSGFFSPEHPADNLRLFLEPMLRLESWLWLVGIALAVWLGVNLVNLTLLYRRSRELRQAFREMYPGCGLR